MTYQVHVGERLVTVEITAAGDGWAVSVDGGPPRQVHGARSGATDWRLDVDGAHHVLGLHLAGERFMAQVAGLGLSGTVVDARRAALDMAAGGAQGEVRTMMPGAVVRIPVSVGQAVHKGQVLVVVEAMKMENEFKSPIDGVVQEIPVRLGLAVETHAVLIVVAPA